MTTVLAVVLPLACALALFLVRPTDEPDAVRGRRPGRRSPGPPWSARRVSPTSRSRTAAEGVRGPVQVGRRRRSGSRPAGCATVDAGPDPVAVDGRGRHRARAGRGPASVRAPPATCVAPTSTSWFTGVGAGAGHRSVLELTNPDSGTAVADVTVYGRNGRRRRAAAARRVGPGRQQRASSTSPRSSRAATSSRSRSSPLVAGSARRCVDRIEPIGRGATATDWLPGAGRAGDVEPAARPRAAADAARRTLVVANGGPDEVLASVQVVTEESVFAPKDVPDLRIPPQSTAQARPSPAPSRTLLEDGATGLLVTANEPVSTALRTYVEGDLSHAVPDPGRVRTRRDRPAPRRGQAAAARRCDRRRCGRRSWPGRPPARSSRPAASRSCPTAATP